MKRKAMIAVIACIALILVSQAALGEVAYSERYSAVKAAREALSEKYGFDQLTLGLLWEDVQWDDDTLTMTFSPILMSFDSKAVGIYTVTVEKGKVADVSWTHDGANIDASSDGYLDSRVWRHAQLKNAYTIDTLVKWSHSLTDEERDALAKLREDTRCPEDAWPANLPPRPEDFDEGLAIKLATKALIAKYGLDAESLAKYSVSTYYYRTANDREATYGVYWNNPVEDNPEQSYDVFSVEIGSPSGNIKFCACVYPSKLTLPEGPLDNYFEAVSEFILYDAFQNYSHQERAEIIDRINRVQYRPALSIQYVAPGASDITEEEAIAIALEVLEEKQGLTEELSTLFERAVSFVYNDGEPCWVITYTPELNVYLPDHVEKMGYYQAKVRGSDGQPLDWHWSVTIQESDLPMTEVNETNWAQAAYWHAGILPYVKTLNDGLGAILKDLEQIDVNDPWPLEARSAHDQLCRDAGFTADYYPCAMPDTGELPEEEATAIAKLALLSEYGLTEEDLGNHRFYSNFYINSEKRAWSFIAYSLDRLTEHTYYVELDAKTGEILHCWHTSSGNG